MKHNEDQHLHCLACGTNHLNTELIHTQLGPLCTSCAGTNWSQLLTAIHLLRILDCLTQLRDLIADSAAQTAETDYTKNLP